MSPPGADVATASRDTSYAFQQQSATFRPALRRELRDPFAPPTGKRDAPESHGMTLATRAVQSSQSPSALSDLESGSIGGSRLKSSGAATSCGVTTRFGLSRNDAPRERKVRANFFSVPRPRRRWSGFPRAEEEVIPPWEYRRIF
ncbi:MAG TPA: hypothetical protein DEP35_05500 [Deltaproteobacteria bacterium]|jgi:hypothetical protein|nr:hypothetical protein [Deltaproteobacteria bacterium]